MVSPKSRFL